MAGGGLSAERRRLEAYLAERPSAADARGWLDRLYLSRIAVAEYPLEVAAGAGQAFLHHPLLRGWFSRWMCTNVLRIRDWADEVMIRVSEDIASFTPLIGSDVCCQGENSRAAGNGWLYTCKGIFSSATSWLKPVSEFYDVHVHAET
jgi:hypothetical protein